LRGEQLLEGRGKRKRLYLTCRSIEPKRVNWEEGRLGFHLNSTFEKRTPEEKDIGKRGARIRNTTSLRLVGGATQEKKRNPRSKVAKKGGVETIVPTH